MLDFAEELAAAIGRLTEAERQASRGRGRAPVKVPGSRSLSDLSTVVRLYPPRSNVEADSDTLVSPFTETDPPLPLPPAVHAA